MRWLLPLTLPGRTPTRTYICTFKCTLKGLQPGPSTHGTRPYGPSSHSIRAAACTFKCTFKWTCFEVVPQVQLVMWPRGSQRSLRRTHRLAWNPVHPFKGYLASSFQTFQIISILIIYCTSCLTYILIIEGNPSVNPPMKTTATCSGSGGHNFISCQNLTSTKICGGRNVHRKIPYTEWCRGHSFQTYSATLMA